VRISRVERARVPQQCRSAEGKLVLTVPLTGCAGKGKRLIFRYHLCTSGNASFISDALG
jgi:hypothetical protein